MANKEQNRYFKVSTRNSVYYVIVRGNDMRAWKSDKSRFFSGHRLCVEIGNQLEGESSGGRVITSSITSIVRITEQEFDEAIWPEEPNEQTII